MAGISLSLLAQLTFGLSLLHADEKYPEYGQPELIRQNNGMDLARIQIRNRLTDGSIQRADVQGSGHVGAQGIPTARPLLPAALNDPDGDEFPDAIPTLIRHYGVSPFSLTSGLIAPPNFPSGREFTSGTESSIDRVSESLISDDALQINPRAPGMRLSDWRSEFRQALRILRPILKQGWNPGNCSIETNRNFYDSNEKRSPRSPNNTSSAIQASA